MVRRMSTVNATRVRGEVPRRGPGEEGSDLDVLPQGLLLSFSLLPPPGKAKEPSACSPGRSYRHGPWTSMSSGRPRGGCNRAWMAVVACWAPGPVLTSPRCAGTHSVQPANPAALCPVVLARKPRPSGSSGCRSPHSECGPGGADALSSGGPQRPPFSALPASPCTSGVAVVPTAACEQRPWWPWAQPPVPTGPLSRTGTGPGATGCLTWCVWT